MKKIGLILLALFSASSFAGEWSQPLTVKDISYSSGEGRFSRNVQLRVTFDEIPSTSICKSTEALAAYDASEPIDWDSRWISILLSAQAQNKQVKIFVNTCFGGNIHRINGVKILRD